MKIKEICSCALMALGASAMGQTMTDTLTGVRAEEPVTVDGQATEACWEQAVWQPIDQVWMPYNASMDPGDFQGRFKVAWDPDYLYILVEVVDDSLSDDWPDPLEHWWDDDCLEVFIDEDRSGGDHERNCNAFAYHVSLYFDAVDLDANGQGINYYSHVTADRDTLGEDTYQWEFAFRIYDETYNDAQPENSRVALAEGKLMGLAIAYCDNDETQARENFIGSMYMTAAHNNDMYKNADYFGPLVLSGENSTGRETQAATTRANVWPNPAREEIYIHIPRDPSRFPCRVLLTTTDGRSVGEFTAYGPENKVSVSGLEPGLYILHISAGEAFNHSCLITIE